jgi:hypothetical protein
MPPAALLQHVIHIRQALIGHNDPHPAALNPPAVRALKAHDHTWLAGTAMQPAPGLR